MSDDHSTSEKPTAPRPPEPPERPVEDALSPAKERRDRAMESRSERVGDGTPIGPETSPPVDPDSTGVESG